MTTELFNANLAVTNVLSGGTDAPPAGTVETWVVSSYAGFPTAVTGVSQFHIADPGLNTEIIAVTNTSGSTWTVTRGAENTIPLAHAAGFVIYQIVTTGFLTSPTFGGAVSTGGLTGATAASRYAGATTSGAPVSGTFALGDYVVDQTGTFWVCTVAGTPGTWIGSSAAVVPASGDATGATDVAVLNAAILTASGNGGGVVKGSPGGFFYLNAPIALHSKVTLDMTGCTITEVAGSNCNMTLNAAATAVATSTGTVTSGGSVITTALAASASIGQSIIVAGAGGGGNSPLVGLISAVNGSTAVTITNLDGSTLTATASATAATTSLYNRDSNIAIQGGFWNRGSNAGSGTNEHSFLFRHVDTYTVHLQGFTSTAGKYCVNPADCTNGWGSIRDINSASDGWHINGPHYGCVIDLITGTTGDDSFAATGSDYTAWNDSSGNIIGVTIGTIDTTVTSGRQLSCVPGVGNLIDGIKVTGQILGVCEIIEGPVFIGDDVAYAQTTGGTIGSIDLGSIASQVTTANQLVFLLSPSAAHIKVNLDWAGAYALPYGVLCWQNGSSGNAGTTIEHLEVSGNLSAVSAPSGHSTSVVYVNCPGTVAKITLNGFVYQGNTANAGGLVYLLAGTVGEIDLINCSTIFTSNSGNPEVVYLSSGGACGQVNILGGNISNTDNLIVDYMATAVTYFLGGGLSINSNRIMSLYGAAVKTVILAGCNVSSLSIPAFYLQTSSLVFVGDGLNMSASYTLIQRSASESVTQANLNTGFLPGTFTAPGTTPSGHWYGSIITDDITVQPNSVISTSASMFLDNTAGQVWEFFCASGGAFGVFDKTNSAEPFAIINGSPNGAVTVNGTYFKLGSISLDVNTAGQGLAVAEGSNAKQGIGTLASGGHVVANASVTANSRIFLTTQSPSGTLGSLYVSGRTAATSFAVASTSLTDNSVFAYEIFEPG